MADIQRLNPIPVRAQNQDGWQTQPWFGDNDQVAAAEERKRHAQVEANSAAVSFSVHALENSEMGSHRVTEPIMFTRHFTSEPSFTTGGFSMGNDAASTAAYQAAVAAVEAAKTDRPVPGGGDAGVADLVGPAARRTGVILALDRLREAQAAQAETWSDPLLSAGVYRWLKQGELYIGAYVYLVAFVPKDGEKDDGGGGGGGNPPEYYFPEEPTASLARLTPEYADERVQRVRRETTPVQTPVRSGRFLHWVRFEEMGIVPQSATVASQTAKDLPSRTPGVGAAKDSASESTRWHVYGDDIQRLHAVATNLATLGTGTAEYLEAKRHLDTARRVRSFTGETGVLDPDAVPWEE